MNKKEFVAAIAEQTGLSNAKAAEAVKAFTDVVTETMKRIASRIRMISKTI